MPDHVPNETLDGDRPIGDPKHDRLGFSEIAKHLADAFTQNDLSEGFVIGVEGAWGSGKSSLVGMAFEHLKKRNTPPGVVEFQPWLVGSSQELLTELFSLLAEELKRRDPTAGATTSEILKRFAAISTGLGTVAEWVGKAGVPGAALAGEALKQVGGGAAGLATSSLADLKKALVDNLAKLTSPIIVFIDDLDRLDPSEAVEVLRLVRAVADFPNVAYILAYDPEVLAHNLERALQIKDGRVYLEKIVQASFRVPMPMNYDLMNWFGAEVRKLFPSQQSAEDPDDRLANALHTWSPVFLETPRDVVRALNSLRLYALPVADKIDIADMVFLQLVRLKMPGLYEWIEVYVADLAAVGDWGSLSPDGDKRAGTTLLEALKAKPDHHRNIMHGLRDHLPGIPYRHADKDSEGYKVSFGSSRADLANAKSNRRLISPHHYRLYFAFTEPAGIISGQVFLSFIEIAKTDPNCLVEEFKRLAQAARPQCGTMADVLLDHLVREKTLPEEAIEPLLFALAHGMDDLQGADEWDRNYLFGGGKDAAFGIFRFMAKEKRVDFLKQFAFGCKSLSWLTMIVRNSTFDHGFYGTRPKPSDELLLSSEEFESLRIAFLKRVQATDPKTIRETRGVLSLLYAWYQGGDPEGAKAWVATQIAQDANFVDLLERFQGKGVSSSVGMYRHIDQVTLDTFFASPNAAEQRLAHIVQTSTSLKDRANRLLTSIAAGQNH